MKYQLEICVDSLESAIIAAENGADEIELCSNLIIGGTTPTRSLFLKVKESIKLPINVLIRPRYGDFLYSDYEWEEMIEEAKFYAFAGAHAIVTGSLNKDGSLNTIRMQMMKREIGEKKLRLHRAFDVGADPIKIINDAIQCGIEEILTSGQTVNCLKGMDYINQWIKKYAEIKFIIGGGITSKNIEKILAQTLATSVHRSEERRVGKEC